MGNEDNVMAEMGAAVEQGRAGDREGARIALEKLWEKAAEPLHRCSIAHFAADLQDSVADELMWDERALAALTGEHLQENRAFLPSLHLNLADVHRRAGHPAEARHHLDAAGVHLDLLSDDEYGRMIRSGIERNRAELGG